MRVSGAQIVFPNLYLKGNTWKTLLSYAYINPILSIRIELSLEVVYYDSTLVSRGSR